MAVMHEAFGLTNGIRDWCERFAAEGYLALAPDSLRGGPPGSARRCLLAASARCGRDVDAPSPRSTPRAHLATREVCTGRIGIVGFCMGGGFALLAASRGFQASAPNYGPLPRDPDAALRGACPIVASFGGRDRVLSGAAERLDATLIRLGVEHDVREYRTRATRSSTGTPGGWAPSTEWRASASTSRRPRTRGVTSTRSSTLICSRPQPDGAARSGAPAGLYWTALAPM